MCSLIALSKSCCIAGIMLLLCPIFGIGQKLDVPTIERDTLTSLLKDQVPFDRRFVIKIKADQKPRFISYMANKKGKSWYESINYYTGKRLGIFPGRKRFIFDTIPSEHIQLKKENGISYLYIEFKELPYGMKTTQGHNNNFLSPSKKYTVIIPKLYEKAIDAFDLYFKGDSASGDAIVQGLIDKQIADFNLQYFIPNPDNARSFFRNNLLQDYYARQLLEADFQTSLSYTALIRGFENRPYILNLINNLTAIAPSLSLPNRYIDTVKLIQGLRTLYELSSFNKCKAILEGACSIMDTAVGGKSPGIDKSLANLKETTEILQLIESYLTLLQFQHADADRAQGLKEVRALILQCIAQQDALGQIQAKVVAIKQKVVDKSIFLEPGIVEGSTYIFDFKTRSKLQITPDFGYVVYGFQKGFTSFTPYLGFNINFRPVDKNIPWRLYPNKTIWHRLSFSTGWTLSGVEEKGKRENFFSGSSLLTGIGFRWTNAIKSNFGSLWFYKDDTNPLIEKRKIATTFYFGISIDLDLKELLNDFTSLKPNVK